MATDKMRIKNWAAHIFSHFACLPSPLSALVRTRPTSINDECTYNIRSKWKQTDYSRNGRLVINKEDFIFFPNKCETPQVLFSSFGTISFGSYPPSLERYGNILWDIEQNFVRVLFTEFNFSNDALGESEVMKASSSAPGTYVSVFCLKSGKKIKTIKLPTLSSKNSNAVSGRVYGSGDPSAPFSSCRFCPTDSNLIVYLSEYSSSGEVKGPSESDASSVPERSPFILKENWGEGLSDTTRPVICILNLETEEVSCLQSKLEKITPESKHWSFDNPHFAPDGKGIVFVAYNNNPYRLGLVYCYQRESRLMYWNFQTSELRCLSSQNHAAWWPRFSPDNSKLIWFEIPAGGPHGQCFKMLFKTWPPNQSDSEVVVPLIAVAEHQSDFPGLYLSAGVPERCWTSDSKGVVLSTTWGAETALIYVDLSSNPPGRISRFPSPLTNTNSYVSYGSTTLLDINDDVLVVAVSSPAVPDFLAVAKISHEDVTNTKWLNLNLAEDAQPAMPCVKGLTWKVLEHSANTGDPRFGVKRFESILVYPTADSSSLQFSEGLHFDGEVTWKSICGLIVIPHGGPHSAFTSEWLSSVTSYVAAGFACLLVNYRGSIGYGNSSVYSLPGNCGILDVADCVQATEDALRELNTPRLPCVLLGGSHGGFLVLHLAGRHSSLYRAVVARNPVTNLVSMLSTTDIPDWCWAEAGIGLDDAVVDREHPEYLFRDRLFTSNFCPTDPKLLTRLASCSPIIHVSSKWSVPILMCIGSKDQRVPNEQGISFIRALRAHLGERAGETMCQTVRFPTEAHPLQSPAALKENFVLSVEWYYQALGLLQV